MSRLDGSVPGADCLGADPLGPAEGAALLGPWIGPGSVYRGGVLAVSGGPDSTALMGCAALVPRGLPVIVATVDHGLRPASAVEAQAVAALAARLGLAHRILAWTGPKPAAHLQEAARAARYRLLAGLAREAGADLVLTAHTLDDQAETVLMRLCAGSGPAGLAGMAPARALDGVTLGRPFLGVPKARLVATCDSQGWPFVRDPSNADPRFGRARLRRLMPLLAEEGLTPGRLVRLAGRLRRDEAALAQAAASALSDLRRSGPDGHGTLILDGAGLATLPEAVALRVVGLAVKALREDAAADPPRLGQLERIVLGEVLPALRKGIPCRRTVAGLLLAAGAGRLSLSPAPPRRPSRPHPA
ncbi:tRNA lysidine(34) synthetase TilS [Methylobacterium aquaticum]|uniref:tRNA lysidine(34) synthetase TilS n=1 Tax=Methylobacterium aquaticum TaxID=270351 RepID=UPI003D16C5B5